MISIVSVCKQVPTFEDATEAGVGVCTKQNLLSPKTCTPDCSILHVRHPCLMQYNSNENVLKPL